MEKQPKFEDNPAVEKANGQYLNIIVDTRLVIESWQDSIFSFEWLTPDGKIKEIEALSENEREKRRAVEEKLFKERPVSKAVLGIGLKDNIEIGSGRAEFLTLAANGARQIPVHIPKSCESDFKPFLADID